MISKQKIKTIQKQISSVSEATSETTQTCKTIHTIHAPIHSNKANMKG